MVAAEQVERIFREEHEMDETQIPDDRLKLMFTYCHPYNKC